MQRQGVTVDDSLPSGLTYVGSDASQGSYNSSTGVWSVGALDEGGEAHLKIEAWVDAGTAGRTLINTASVSANEDDPNGPNDDSAVVKVKESEVDLRIKKSVDDRTLEEGDTITFYIDVINEGPGDATGVKVDDPLPSGLTYLSSHASQGSYSAGGSAGGSTGGAWNVGTLRAGEGARLEIEARVDAGTARSHLVNSARISDVDQDDPTSWNNRDSVDVDVTDEGSIDHGEESGGHSDITVAINEICWAGTKASADDQWIELINPGDSDLSLIGWTLVISYPTDEQKEDEKIPLSGTIHAHGFYLLERGDDSTIANIPADLIFLPPLPSEGGTLRLVDPTGAVVDVINPDGGPWPAGLALPELKASMERVDPKAPGERKNWRTNDTVERNGVDAGGFPINGTPKHANSGE